MNHVYRNAVGLLLAVGIAGCSQPAGAHETAAPAAAEARFSFEDVAVGSLPRGWRAGETNGQGTPAHWRVEEGAGPSGGRLVVCLAETENSGSTFNVLLVPEEFPADLELSVGLRADAGEEDQGGGLLWRARDADNYYVARWNPLEDNVRAYTVVNGRRSMLRSADVTADPGAWHILAIEARGTRIRVLFDGVEVLSLEDVTFAEGGFVGLWTKADAATTFDELRVAPPGNE